MENKLNDEQLHIFIKGWQADFDAHIEMAESYNDAWNGRLY